MRKTLIVLGVLVIAGIGAWFYFLRPLKAPTVSTGEASEGTPTPTPSQLPEGVVQFVLSSDNSEASFAVGEVLLGEKQTTTGSTKQISGEILINTIRPQDSKIGTIKINARTFKTDNSRRDSAIGRFILNSEQDQYEFIEFKPTTVTDLPLKLPDGSVNFKITGDLNIAGAIKSVIFDATAQYAENTLAGNATATIKRSQLNIKVPLSESVASVDDNVILTINFIVPQSQ